MVKVKKEDARAVGLLKLLSSLTRFRILRLLHNEQLMIVGDIAKCLGMTHSAISHQLAILRSAGVVHSAFEGRAVAYSIPHKYGVLLAGIYEVTRVAV